MCLPCAEKKCENRVWIYICVPLLLQFLHFTRAVKFSKAFEKRLFAKIVAMIPNSVMSFGLKFELKREWFTLNIGEHFDFDASFKNLTTSNSHSPFSHTFAGI